jgi:hypothetical protein
MIGTASHDSISLLLIKLWEGNLEMVSHPGPLALHEPKGATAHHGQEGSAETERKSASDTENPAQDVVGDFVSSMAGHDQV